MNKQEVSAIFSGCKGVKLIAGGIVASLFGISLLAGCEPVEPVDATGGTGEFGIEQGEERPDDGQVSPAPEQEGAEAEEFDMFEGAAPEPEEIDIEDPDRAPDTVLATVNGEDILLQDLYDEFALYPPQHQQQIQHQQHRLLDDLIRQELLLQKAREKEIQESAAYKELIAELEASPEVVEELDREVIENYALTTALLDEEVLGELDFSDEELRALYDEYEHMMPEGTAFDEIKPQLEQMLEQQERQEKGARYVRELYEAAEVDVDQAWLEEKEQEGAEAGPPVRMPEEGEAPPVQ